MKKFCLLTTTLSMALVSVQAQIPKGTKLIGGTINYHRTSEDQTYTYPYQVPNQRKFESTQRTFTVNPRVGAFISENLAVGLAAAFNSNKHVSPYYTAAGDLGKQVITNKGFSVAPFLRYYYMPTENFGVFGELTAGYSYHKGKTRADSSDVYQTTGFSKGGFARITPALVFFPTNKLGVELSFGSIGYSRNHNELKALQLNQSASDSRENSFGASFGLDYLSVGASLYLGR